MPITKWESGILKALFALEGLLIALQLAGLDAWVSGLFTLTFPLVALLWLCSIRKTIRLADIGVFLTVTLAAVCVLIDCGRSGGDFRWAYGKKLIMFGATVLFFSAMDRLQVDRKLADYLGGLTDLLALLFVGRYLFAGATHPGTEAAYLSFGFTNPNLATLFLSQMAVLQLLRAGEKRKLLHSLLAVCLLYFVVRAGSRNAMLALAISVIAYGCLRKRREIRIGKWLSGFLAWLPLVFAAVYMLLVRQAWVQAVFSFFSAAGKPLSSRAEVWQRAWDAIGQSPLWGGYYSISDGTGASQMHNSHLDVAASYGVVVLVLLCAHLRRWLMNGRNLYIIGFVAVLLLGFGEAAFFSGGLGVYLFAGMFLLLSKGEWYEDRIHQQLHESSSKAPV